VSVKVSLTTVYTTFLKNKTENNIPKCRFISAVYAFKEISEFL
jgi:hypothetical protein